MKTAIYSTTRKFIANTSNVKSGKGLMNAGKELVKQLTAENPHIEASLLISELAIFMETVIKNRGAISMTDVAIDHIGPLKQFTVYGEFCQFNFQGLGNHYFAIRVFGYHTSGQLKLTKKSSTYTIKQAFDLK